MTPTPWPLDCHLDLRDGLLGAYGAPERGYHDLHHLAEVLEHATALLQSEPGEPTTIALAAWYHDAVYDGARDDEERSALLAEQQLSGAGVSGTLVAEVARLVRLTATHDPGAHDANGRVLSDADLAILAAAPERYAAYVAGVRRDFADHSDEEFRAGRLSVLETLAGRDRLFHTGTGHELWNAAARANLAREIAALSR